MNNNDIISWEVRMTIMKKIILTFIAFVFGFQTLSAGVTYANTTPGLTLPPAGQLMRLGTTFAPLSFKGLILHPENALRFDFLMDTGTQHLTAEQVKAKALTMSKYFLTALTMPEKDMWVNLSPYEKNRIVEENLGHTIMGRDMLAQDYILKQLTASVIYPEKAIGQKFWQAVYQRAVKEYGSSTVPINAINKVWIVPDKATVLEQKNKVLLVNARLKVMLQEDYIASRDARGANAVVPQAIPVASDVIREIVLPQLEREVNEGAHFAQLRQMYQAMILATWYKRALKNSILVKVYGDKRKVAGVDNKQTGQIEIIYNQYLRSFKKGLFNYIKESDTTSQEKTPRKYFSGGLGFDKTSAAMVSLSGAIDKTQLNGLSGSDMATIVRIDAAQIGVGALESSHYINAVMTDASLPIDLVFDPRVEAFFNILQRKNIFSISVVGGAALDILLQRKSNDIDFTVNIPVEDDLVSNPDAGVPASYADRVIKALEPLAKALSLPVGRFFDPQPIRFRIPGGHAINLQYIGPRMNPERTQVSLGVVVDPERKKVITSYTAPSLLQMAVSVSVKTRQIIWVGAAEPLQDFLNKEVRLQGDIQTAKGLTIAAVMKWLRLIARDKLIPIEADIELVRKWIAWNQNQINQFDGLNKMIEDLIKLAVLSEQEEEFRSLINDIGLNQDKAMLLQATPAANNKMKEILEPFLREGFQQDLSKADDIRKAVREFFNSVTEYYKNKLGILARFKKWALEDFNGSFNLGSIRTRAEVDAQDWLNGLIQVEFLLRAKSFLNADQIKQIVLSQSNIVLTAYPEVFDVLKQMVDVDTLKASFKQHVKDNIKKEEEKGETIRTVNYAGWALFRKNALTEEDKEFLNQVLIRSMAYADTARVILHNSDSLLADVVMEGYMKHLKSKLEDLQAGRYPEGYGGALSYLIRNLTRISNEIVALMRDYEQYRVTYQEEFKNFLQDILVLSVKKRPRESHFSTTEYALKGFALRFLKKLKMDANEFLNLINKRIVLEELSNEFIRDMVHFLTNGHDFQSWDFETEEEILLLTHSDGSKNHVAPVQIPLEYRNRGKILQRLNRFIRDPRLYAKLIKDNPNVQVPEASKQEISERWSRVQSFPEDYDKLSFTQKENVKRLSRLILNAVDGRFPLPVYYEVNNEIQARVIEFLRKLIEQKGVLADEETFRAVFWGLEKFRVRKESLIEVFTETVMREGDVKKSAYLSSVVSLARNIDSVSGPAKKQATDLFLYFLKMRGIEAWQVAILIDAIERINPEGEEDSYPNIDILKYLQQHFSVKLSKNVFGFLDDMVEAVSKDHALRLIATPDTYTDVEGYGGVVEQVSNNDEVIKLEILDNQGNIIQVITEFKDHTRDQAQAVDTVGGISLNAADLSLDVQQTATGNAFFLDQDVIEQISAGGLQPAVVSVTTTSLAQVFQFN